jgi:hypothetical protein
MTIIESTPTKLTFTLGLRFFNWARCEFDKSTGKARFDQTKFFFPCKTIEVPLSDIGDVRVGTATSRDEGVTEKTQYPEVLFKSLKQLALCNGAVTPKSAREAVDRMRLFLGLDAMPGTK